MNITFLVRSFTKTFKFTRTVEVSMSDVKRWLRDTYDTFDALASGLAPHVMQGMDVPEFVIDEIVVLDDKGDDFVTFDRAPLLGNVFREITQTAFLYCLGRQEQNGDRWGDAARIVAGKT